MSTAPKLKRVIRLDSLPLNQTYFTDEGYLIDRPILTSIGIFEYQNPDGSVRRELRLPDEVFASESLKTYKGKPIIITHNAGLVTKDNVQRHHVGTILSEGYRSGNDVRAEIIIHDTNGMKSSGLKELSLGYNLELDETPGEWEGQPYDAIQRNISINHLALVFEARAGEQARLNIDGRDRKNAKGGTPMQTKKNGRRADGVMSPDDLKKAIEEYKTRRAQRVAAKADTEGKPTEDPADNAVSRNTPATDGDTVVAPAGVAEKGDTYEEKLQMVKDRRDRRDADGDPADQDAAAGIIAQQDEDIGTLFDIIDTLLAQRDFDCAATELDGAGSEPAAEPAKQDESEGAAAEGEEKNLDSDDSDIPTTQASEVGKSVLNVDAMDRIVRQRIQLGMIGRELNMDGLENMSIMEAKKAIITAVRPGLRLDGKSDTYVEAAYDFAVSAVKSQTRKGTDYQKRQMFNQDAAKSAEEAGGGNSSADARRRMIERQQNKKKEDK